MKAESPSKAQGFSSDIISTLPQTIIENILCLLSIEEAARTSILSREWRYKWTTIPKLEFYGSSLSTRKFDEEQFFRAIHQVLLLRQGPIHEFKLTMFAYADWDCDCFQLDQIILHLSRNHSVQKLSLDLDDLYFYKLPLAVFSLHQLTELHLRGISLDHKPTFSGFGSLRSLYLKNVRISTKALLHLLYNCPSLMSFNLLTEHIGFRDCTVIEVFNCLPVIEDLTLRGKDLSLLVLDLVPKEIPASLIHLRYFCLKDMCFPHRPWLTFLLVLIKSSPNLEYIRIKTDRDEDTYSGANEMCSDILAKYSDVWLEHLMELFFIYFRNLETEMEFVKFIMARSPNLEKVSIFLDTELHKGQELKILVDLIRAPRVSPMMEIVVYGKMKTTKLLIE